MVLCFRLFNHMLLVFIFVFATQSWAFDATAWEPIENTNLKAMWKSKTVKDAFVNLYEEKNDFDLASFKPDEYVKNIPQVRSFLHTIVRINNYQISEHSSEQKNDAWLVKIKGTYLRKGKTPVNFCESHLFEKKSFKQKSISAPTASWKEVLGEKGDCFITMGDIK